MSYDRWKTRAPDIDGPEEPSLEQQRADYEDEMQQRMECDVCSHSKWKSACPECDGTGEIIVSEKIKYWWSEDRKFFCILANDGESQATVSLTVDEAEALMGEVMQTPSFLKLQEEAWQRARQLMDERASAGETKRPLTGISDDELFTIQCAVENLRSADQSESQVEAAWRIASNLEALAKRISQQAHPRCP